ncbi:MAG: hypothetical protein HQK83_04050 [Fibrobacteria bacterium]|nr:hypothetical protein [Fibrobacteria bacterium]
MYTKSRNDKPVLINIKSSEFVYDWDSCNEVSITRTAQRGNRYLDRIFNRKSNSPQHGYVALKVDVERVTGNNFSNSAINIEGIKDRILSVLSTMFGCDDMPFSVPDVNCTWVKLKYKPYDICTELYRKLRKNDRIQLSPAMFPEWL